MAKIQEIFNRIQETKKEQKEIKAMYRDALSHSQKYQQAVDELTAARDKKKQIEDEIKSDFNAEFEKLETLKLDLENDNMLLSDAALTKFIKGENVEITDQYENKYEPQFSVKFKKS